MKKRWFITVCILLVGIMILSACSSSKEEEQKDLANYTLQLEVMLEQNLMFSTYDVEIAIDGEKLGTVKQGETFTKDIVLTEGKHEFKANKSGDSSVKGTTTITLDSDKAFSCSLKSHSSSIDINNQLEEALADYNSRKEKEKEEAEAIAAAEQAEKEKKEAEEKAAQEKAEAEAQAAKEKEEAEKKAREAEEAKKNELKGKLDAFEGKLLSDVYDDINSLGLTVTYYATNTGQDMTSVIADVTSSYYVDSYYLGYDGKSVDMYVTPDFILEQEKVKEELSAVLDEYSAWGAAEYYGITQYGNFTLHYVMGKLGAAPNADGVSWDLKAECTVNGQKMVCEATVTGTDDNPVVTYFLVY